MQQNTPPSSMKSMPVRLEDFGALQLRYQSLQLAKRAQMVLDDAEPALHAAEEILRNLSTNAHTKQAFLNIRRNVLLADRMRPSEARTMLMDANSDFINGARHKLAAWRKTMERLGTGEDIRIEQGREYIPGDAPLAMAIAGNSLVSSYLSIIQLVLTELKKIDAASLAHYNALTAEMRRCSTVLSDCEIASAIASVVQ